MCYLHICGHGRRLYSNKDVDYSGYYKMTEASLGPVVPRAHAPRNSSMSAGGLSARPVHTGDPLADCCFDGSRRQVVAERGRTWPKGGRHRCRSEGTPSGPDLRQFPGGLGTVTLPPMDNAWSVDTC